MYDIMMINPPLCVNEYPLLGLPYMKAYLTSQGIENVKTIDFNAEIMMSIIYKGMKKVSDYYEEKGIDMPVSKVIDNFDKARAALRDENVTKDKRQLSMINTYLKIAGSNIFDIAFNPLDYATVKKGLLEMDINASDNIIINYIREKVIPCFKNSSYIVAISVPFSSQLFYALLTAREIKRQYPGLYIVLGGSQITLFHNILINDKEISQYFDGLIIGEGIQALKAIYNHVVNGAEKKDISNFVYRDGDNVVQTDEPTEMIYSHLLTPDFSDINFKQYIYPKIPYKITDGCYWGKCVFCTYRKEGTCKSNNIDKVLSDIEMLKRKYGLFRFQFIDDAIEPRLLDELSQKILERGINIRYDAYLRLDKNFTEEKCCRYYESGLRSVLFGMETSNAEMLKIMNKGMLISDAVEVLKAMKKAKISNVLSCITGFPTETAAMARETTQFLLQHKDLYDVVFIMHFGMISDLIIKNQEKYQVEQLNLNDFRRYDDTGFVALEFPYKCKTGMSRDESYKILRESREALGIINFGENLFS